MKIFKHRHNFQKPKFSEVWELVHQDIFVEGKKEATIEVKCKCGETTFKRINVMLNYEE